MLLPNPTHGHQVTAWGVREAHGRRAARHVNSVKVSPPTPTASTCLSDMLLL